MVRHGMCHFARHKKWLVRPDLSKQRATPFLVAVNCFDGAPGYQPEDVQIALDLDPGTPVMLCDARQRGSVKKVLIALVRHAIAKSGVTPAVPRKAAARGLVP